MLIFIQKKMKQTSYLIFFILQRIKSEISGYIIRSFFQCPDSASLSGTITMTLFDIQPYPALAETDRSLINFYDDLIDDRVCKGRESAERSTVPARQTAMISQRR